MKRYPTGTIANVGDALPRVISVYHMGAYVMVDVVENDKLGVVSWRRLKSEGVSPDEVAAWLNSKGCHVRVIV